MSYPRLEKAIQFALEAHRGKYRKGPDPLPYFTHALDVLHKTRHLGLVTDEDALCAAVLHDTIEDESVSPAAIEQQFGPEVRRLVLQLTRRGQPGEARYSEMLLEDIASMDPNAQVIKLADRLSNLWESKRTRSAERTMLYAEEAIRMLEIIPRERAPELWETLLTLSKKCLESPKPVLP